MSNSEGLSSARRATTPPVGAAINCDGRGPKQAFILDRASPACVSSVLRAGVHIAGPFLPAAHAPTRNGETIHHSVSPWRELRSWLLSPPLFISSHFHQFAGRVVISPSAWCTKKSIARLERMRYSSIFIGTLAALHRRWREVPARAPRSVRSASESQREDQALL